MASDTFDAVLADMLGESTLFLHEITDYHTRLAAAHAAEVAERDARIAELAADLEAMIDGNAYACQRAEAAERDARELRDTLREAPSVLAYAMNLCNGLASEALQDEALRQINAYNAKVRAAIATTEQAAGGLVREVG